MTNMKEFLFYFSTVIIFDIGGAAQIIQFFDNDYYNGLIYESILTSKCESLPDSVKGKTSSVKTPECVHLFARADCKGQYFIVDPTPNDESLNGKKLIYFNDLTTSFRACNVNNKTDKVYRIKLFEHQNFETLLVDTVITKSCTNLPNTVINKVTSAIAPVCVVLFSYGGCKGARYELSNTVENGNHSFITDFNDEVDSFRPCNPHDLDKPDPVAQLVAEILQVDFYLDESIDENTDREPVEIPLGPEVHVFNNGSVLITREYNFNKKVPEPLIVTKTNNFGLPHALFGLSRILQYRYTSEIPIPILARLESIFVEALINKEKVFKNVEMQEFSHSEKLQIVPCTWYRFTPTAKLVKNFKVMFKAKAEVTGQIGSKEMDQVKINEMLQRNGMEVILSEANSTDSGTELKGTVTLDFVSATAFVGNGGRIDNCQNITP